MGFTQSVSDAAEIHLRRFGGNAVEFCQRQVRGYPAVSALVFGLLSFAMFAAPPLGWPTTPPPGQSGSILFNDKGIVWSMPGNDLSSQLVPWWKFGYSELSRGNLPLWNPHNFCGTPFFSNFNPGLLYPLHLLNLLLPLQRALNVIIVINVFLAGGLTGLWCRGRGISALGSIVGGVIFMFSGAYFHHTFAGHEPPLAAIALTPLVFLCIDGILRDMGWRWCLLGAFAVGMQILAGFPQAVYYTGLMGGLYLLLRLRQVTQWRRALLLFTLMYAGGTILGAVQVLPGFQTAGESVRSGGNSLEFAEESPLPPMSLVQFLGPVLGDGTHSDYLGSGYPWEVSVFCGITTLVLAGYGWVYGDQRRGFAGTLLVISTLLAISVSLRIAGHPIIFELMYYCVPLFSTFRTVARFNWFMTLYLAMLAAIGFDVLCIVCRTSWRPAITVLVAAALLFLLGVCCHVSGHAGIYGQWGRLIRGLLAAKDRVYAISEDLDDVFAAHTADYARTQLFFSAVVLVAMAGALVLLRLAARFSFVLAAITVAELYIFAASILARGPMYLPYPSNWTAATLESSHDSRMLHPTLEFPNTAMLYNYDDVYGYDPVTLKRYADYVAATQDQDPDRVNFVTQIMRLKYPKLFQLLRCEYVFFTRDALDANKQRIRVPEILRVDSPLPHLLLMQKFAIGRSRAEVLDGLRDLKFDPRQTVWLESPPDPEPAQEAGTSSGSAWVVKSSTDWLEIKADLPAPAILLVTDAYSKYWHAKAMEPGPQTDYNVMPADYALRGIPLAAGHHHILLTYAPAGYNIGKWISIVALPAWLCLMIRVLVQRARVVTAVEDHPVPAAAAV
jgi:hypothetical protein